MTPFQKALAIASVAFLLGGLGMPVLTNVIYGYYERFAP